MAGQAFAFNDVNHLVDNPARAGPAKKLLLEAWEDQKRACQGRSFRQAGRFQPVEPFVSDSSGLLTGGADLAGTAATSFEGAGGDLAACRLHVR